MAKLVILLVAMVVGVLGESKIDLNENEVPMFGSKAELGAFPYQVSIRDVYGGHVCGGAIINPTVILTSAQCLKKRHPFALTVVVGTNKVGFIIGSKYYGVAKLIPHENYQFPYNNIGLVKLSSPIEYTWRVAPIELPTEESVAGVPVNVTGWGQDPSKHLMWLNLETISNDECNEKHANTAMTILDTEICTSNNKTFQPFHLELGSVLATRKTVVGISSWEGNRPLGLPDVYTRVSSYIDWISANSD